MRPDGRPTWTAGSLAVLALAVALAVGFAANFVWELQTLAVRWPPVVVFLLGEALAGGLAYAARWLAASDLAVDEQVRVARWCWAGTAMLGAVAAVTVVVRLAEGRPVMEPHLPLLVAASAGGLAGTIAGHREVLARRQAATAERTRDSMAFLNRTLRHELLNGVQLLGGHATNLRDAVEDDDALQSVETIADTSEEMADLIEDVRQVADVHTGEADLEPVDVAAVLAEEAEWLDGAYPHATVETDLPDRAVVRANDAVEHVFRNLLTNAVEHNDGDPTVTVDADVNSTAVAVRVADDGPGIPDEEKGAVLEPDGGGTHGFGLHLTRTLVDGYGGSIAVRDNEPRGTVFEVELPRPTAADGGGGGRQSGGDGRTAGADGNGRPSGADGDGRRSGSGGDDEPDPRRSVSGTNA